MKLVKILSDDDGTEVSEPVWHWVQSFGDAERTLCTGEAFGEGESHVVFEVKKVTRGGITCPRCLQIIKKIKSIKL